MYTDDPYVHESEHLRLAENGRKVTALPNAAASTVLRVTYGNTDFYSDGTRWLSSTRYPIVIPFATGITNPLTATTATVFRGSAPDDVYALYVEKFVMRAAQTVIMDATNNWQVDLMKQGNVAVAATSIGNVNNWLGGRTVNTPYLLKIAVNTAYLLTDIYQFSVDFTKFGGGASTLGISPGTVWVRLIGV